MKIYKRDSKGNVKIVGRVILKGSKLSFSDFRDAKLEERLQKGIEFRGQFFKGRALYNQLPIIFRGDRLWAAANH